MLFYTSQILKYLYKFVTVFNILKYQHKVCILIYITICQNFMIVNQIRQCSMIVADRIANNWKLNILLFSVTIYILFKRQNFKSLPYSWYRQCISSFTILCFYILLTCVPINVQHWFWGVLEDIWLEIVFSISSFFVNCIKSS